MSSSGPEAITLRTPRLLAAAGGILALAAVCRVAQMPGPRVSPATFTLREAPGSAARPAGETRALVLGPGRRISGTASPTPARTVVARGALTDGAALTLSLAGPGREDAFVLAAGARPRSVAFRDGRAVAREDVSAQPVPAGPFDLRAELGDGNIRLSWNGGLLAQRPLTFEVAADGVSITSTSAGDVWLTVLEIAGDGFRRAQSFASWWPDASRLLSAAAALLGASLLFGAVTVLLAGRTPARQLRREGLLHLVPALACLVLPGPASAALAGSALLLLARMLDLLAAARERAPIRGTGPLGLVLTLFLVVVFVALPGLLEKFLPAPAPSATSVIRIASDLEVRPHAAMLLPVALRDYDLTAVVSGNDLAPLDLVLREREFPGHPARFEALRLTPFAGGPPYFTSREPLPGPSAGGHRIGAAIPTDLVVRVRGRTAEATVGWAPLPGRCELSDPIGQQIGFAGAGTVKELKIVPTGGAPSPWQQAIASLASFLLVLACALRSSPASGGIRAVLVVSLLFLVSAGTTAAVVRGLPELRTGECLLLASAGGALLSTVAFLALPIGALRKALVSVTFILLAGLFVEWGLRASPVFARDWTPAERLARFKYGRGEAWRSFGALVGQFQDRLVVHRLAAGEPARRVVFLGGSQTYGEDCRAETAAPALAGHGAVQDGTPLDVIVAAARDAVSLEQVLLLDEELVRFEPSVVVLTCGAEDSMAPARDDATAAQELGSIRADLARGSGPGLLSRSRLVSLATRIGERLASRPAGGRLPPPELAAALDLLAQSAAKNRFRVVLCLEPSLLAPPEHHHRVAREAAARHGWPLVDLPAAFAAREGEDLFLGRVHLTERGHAAAAEAMAPVIAAALARR